MYVCIFEHIQHGVRYIRGYIFGFPVFVFYQAGFGFASAGYILIEVAVVIVTFFVNVTCRHVTTCLLFTFTVRILNPALSFWHSASLLAQWMGGLNATFMMWAQYFSIPPFQMLPMKGSTPGTQRTVQPTDTSTNRTMGTLSGADEDNPN